MSLTDPGSGSSGHLCYRLFRRSSGRSVTFDRLSPSMAGSMKSLRSRAESPNRWFNSLKNKLKKWPKNNDVMPRCVTSDTPRNPLQFTFRQLCHTVWIKELPHVSHQSADTSSEMEGGACFKMLAFCACQNLGTCSFYHWFITYHNIWKQLQLLIFEINTKLQ